jgi:hypothetical protein
MTTEYLNNRVFEAIITNFQNSLRKKIRYKLILDDLLETHSRVSRRGEDASQYEASINSVQALQRAAELEHGEAQSKLAVAFYTLSQNIVNYAHFSMIDPDDAIQEGVMICFDKVGRFDSRKGKAFNYMTTCILNHFRQLYRTARNYNELKRKYHEFIQLKLDQPLG